MDWTLGNNFYSTRITAFRPNDLEKEATLKEIKDNKYHIYIICKRKKYYFESCDTSQEDCNVSKFYYLDDDHEKQYISAAHPKFIELKKSKQKGFLTVDIGDGNGDVTLKDFYVFNLLFKMEGHDGREEKGELPSDLEVLYIGQAFGRTTLKKIDYRLVKHEKVQKITSDIVESGTNEDVIIIGVCIETNDTGYLVSKLGKVAPKVTKESLLALAKKAAKRVAEAQEVTLYEAGLIRYFQPDLNTEYKNKFPLPDFTSYDEIYETDFDHISVALEVKKFGARLFSKVVDDRSYLHSKHYGLHTKVQKDSLFDHLFYETEKSAD